MMKQILHCAFTVSCLISLIACSGGGGNSPGTNQSNTDNNWTSGPFESSDIYRAHCVNPRSSINPETGQPYQDLQGTAADEKNWLRSWSNELYLWYDEIIDLNPSNYTTPQYFDLLKTNALTSTGNPKDKFHFSYPTDEWQQLSQSGVSIGYGAQWVILSGMPPRDLRVAYTEPNSPASAAGLGHGDLVMEIDGIDVINTIDNAEIDLINAALFPSQAGESHTFRVFEMPFTGPKTHIMQSELITSTPVQKVQVVGLNEIGYILFNDHIATAEEGLIEAFNTLSAAGASDLFLDIRYNSGGYLAIASQLAYMIAGNARTNGEIFETIKFNDKHPTIDPVTNELLTPIPFINTTIGLSSLPAGQPLPTLNLSRVFVLTGPDTCSASESIINSLRGINFEVIQIGATTCGKPYGFYPTDNCGTTYFSIQFEGENALGFSNYGDGFSPANTPNNIGTIVTGCNVVDDYRRDLGNTFEKLLAAAIEYRDTSTCPDPPIAGETRVINSISDDATTSAGNVYAPKSPWLQNRILTRY